jgi:hypothetical protein
MVLGQVETPTPGDKASDDCGEWQRSSLASLSQKGKGTAPVSP